MARKRRWSKLARMEEAMMEDVGLCFRARSVSMDLLLRPPQVVKTACGRVRPSHVVLGRNVAGITCPECRDEVTVDGYEPVWREDL